MRRGSLLVLLSLALGPGLPGQEPAKRSKAVFTTVRPVQRAGTAPAASLRVGQGRFFAYVLPEGWRVGEDGQFALTLVAPDNQALTVMVGNAGVPPQYPPARFVYEKLSALQPQNLQLGPPRQARPVTGFSQAYEFDVGYAVRGISSRGVAKCNIQVAYDTAVMAMTAALTAANQWAGYSTWLPQVADQISAANGAAFGVRGIMAQNLNNSMAFAEAARNYREWSQKNWQQVTNERNASVDRRNAAVGEMLSGTEAYANPYGNNPPVDMPLTFKYYWMDRNGQYVGTDDPTANPNDGSTVEWRRMNRVKR
ncbi:MAG: hypothetical protein ACKV22_30060 [Bryobacteraceae bacterium]